jgi:hypothetical protein
MRYACLYFSSFRNLSPTTGKSERVVQRDADLTELERSEHIAERVRLADLKSLQAATKSKSGACSKRQVTASLIYDAQ